jgi:hypothetical protein
MQAGIFLILVSFIYSFNVLCSLLFYFHNEHACWFLQMPLGLGFYITVIFIRFDKVVFLVRGSKVLSFIVSLLKYEKRGKQLL